MSLILAAPPAKLPRHLLLVERPVVDSKQHWHIPDLCQCDGPIARIQDGIIVSPAGILALQNLGNNMHVKRILKEVNVSWLKSILKSPSVNRRCARRILVDTIGLGRTAFLRCEISRAILCFQPSCAG